MANYSEVKAAVLGRAFDIDGYYGPQCWDGVFYVAENYLNGKRCHCGITGYVKDVAVQRSTNGILSWCRDVGLKAALQPGDICIWGNCAACPDSHIAFYDHDNGQNQVFFLGQNQGGYGFTVKQIPVSGIIAVFRPDAWGSAVSSGSNGLPAGFTAERGTFTLSVDAINVRDQASTNGSIVAKYTKGQSVNYDCFRADKSGYVWISYISATGKRRYMAAGETNAQGRNTKPYGVFK